MSRDRTIVREGGLELFRRPSRAESRNNILARKQREVGGFSYR
jgi:hypothetical protein